MKEVISNVALDVECLLDGKIVMRAGDINFTISLEPVLEQQETMVHAWKEYKSDFSCGNISNIRRKYSFKSLDEEVQFILFNNTPGMAYRRIVLNSRNITLKFNAIKEKIVFDKNSSLYPDKDLFVFHAENPRIYEVYSTSSQADRTAQVQTSFSGYEPISCTIWSGEGNLRREVGRSPFQPFPAIIYGRKNSEDILLDGTLTQERLYRYYDVDDNKLIWCQAAKNVEAIEIQAGESFAGEWNYVEIGCSSDLNHPYNGYLSAVKNFGEKYRGVTSSNRDSIVWGSWNHGIFRNINQTEIFKTVDFLQNNFPTVKWVQIDEGYAINCHSGDHRVGLAATYHTEGVDPVKFPQGMRYFSDEVKKRGLRPAIWTSLLVSVNTRIFTDHPDWFIVCYQNHKWAVFDVSKPEVRVFIENGLRTLIKDWGFDGIKLDFWSYFFEDEQQVMLPAGADTGTEYRNWLLKTIRELLPAGGYIQLGCDIVMNNILMGKYVDNYRYGIDIGKGEWSNVKTNARWAAFCLNAHTGNFWIPNSDSIGNYPGLVHEEAETAINFCLISRSLVEISGWLHKEADSPLMPYLIKACCCPKNGEDVYFGDFNFKTTNEPPEIWYTRSAHFSMDENNPHLPLRTVSIFNWNDEQKNITFNHKSLDLQQDKAFMLKDYWTGEFTMLAANESSTLAIKPHHSRLFSVSKIDCVPQILDSNVQLNKVIFFKNTLYANMPFPQNAELEMNKKPDRIIINSIEVSFSSLPQAGVVKLNIKILK